MKLFSKNMLKEGNTCGETAWVVVVVVVAVVDVVVWLITLKE